MYALLFKDLCMLRKTLRIYILFLIGYSILAIFAHNTGFLLTFTVLMCVMLPMNAMSVDCACHWERYAACLPQPRSMIVVSKYLLGLVGLALAAVPSLFFVSLTTFIPTLSHMGTTISEVLLMISLGLFMQALQLPFLFRFGPERGRFVSIAIFLLLCLGVPMVTLRTDFVTLNQSSLSDLITGMTGRVNPQILLLVGIGLLLNVISARISIAIHCNRDIE